MMNLGAFVLGSTALLIQQYADFYQKSDLDLTIKQLELDLGLPKIQSFDFIVVGAGTAGCLVAERLSQNFSVLLLEAGGSPPPATYNPSLLLQVQKHAAINYPFVSVPQSHFALGTGGVYTEWTGRMMGGSGSHNSHVHNRGSPHDYSVWANLTGDESWTYANVLQHYKRFENFVGTLIKDSDRDEYYATGGLYTVDTDFPPYAQAWLNAGAQLGFDIVDPNGSQKESFAPVVKNIFNGERVSSYTAFLKPLEDKRSNLTVLRYSVADQILIGKDKTAYGVRYRRHGIPQIAHATREVIISAGTFSSPMILVKSGIGRRDLLQTIGIQVVSDVPGVGARLNDHPGLTLTFISNNKSAFDAIFPHLYTDQDVQQDLNRYQNVTRRGSFNYMKGPQAFLVSSEAKARGEHDWPDLHLLIQRNIDPTDPSCSFDISVRLERQNSIGRMVFNKTAFLAKETEDNKLAQIDFNFYDHPADRNAIVDGIRTVFRVMENTTAFAQLNISHIPQTPQACIIYTYRSDDYWKCVIQYNSISYSHMTSTCKMGADSDPSAVVDSQLRVRGVGKLRVVDASVMPFPTNANINAPTLMIAQKISSQMVAEYLK